MINPTESDIGRKVVYIVRDAMSREARIIDREEGVISSFNASYVFVRYGAKVQTEATSRTDLEWL